MQTHVLTHTRLVPLLFAGVGPEGHGGLNLFTLLQSVVSSKEAFVLQFQVETKCQYFILNSSNSSSQTRSLDVPREGLNHRTVSEEPYSLHSPLLLLQSSRTREIHQVSTGAVPSLPSSGRNVLCPRVVPGQLPPSSPSSPFSCCVHSGRPRRPLGSSPGTCPGPSRRVAVLPAQPGSPALPGLLLNLQPGHLRPGLCE